MILMWFLCVPSSNSRGLALYKDDDKTDEVLAYIIDADGKIVCTVRGIPGLTATEFWGCKDSDPGEDIHERPVLWTDLRASSDSKALTTQTRVITGTTGRESITVGC